MKQRRKLLTAVAAILLAAVALAQPAPKQAELVAALAKPPEHWQVAEAAKAYGEADLEAWLGDEAPRILEYGVSYGISAAYQHDGTRVDLRVLVAKTPLDAFGIFSRQRTDKSKPAALPNASFWEADRFYLWRNYACLRLSPSDSKPDTRILVEDLAGWIADHITAAKELPLLLRLLPPQSQAPGSQTFYRREALGQDALQNGVSATYRTGSQTLTVWLLDCGDRQGARKALGVLAGLLGKTRPLHSLGDEAFAGATEKYGPAVAMREGQYVGATIPAVPLDFAEALLRLATVRIRIAEATGE